MANAPSAPNISLPIADHNAPLVWDTLSTVALNYQWRRVLVHLAENMLDRRIYDGTEAEIDTAIQQVHALLSSMYTENPELNVEKIAARVRSTTPLTATPSTNVVDFDDPATLADAYDSHGFWDSATPTRLTVPLGQGGFYRVLANVRYLGGSLALIIAFIRTRDSGVVAHEVSWTGGGDGFSLLSDVELIEGEWVSLYVQATVNRDIDLRANYSPVLALQRLDGTIVPTSV